MLVEMLQEINHRKHVARRQMTLREFVEVKYTEALAALEVSTQDMFRHYLTTQILPELGELQMQEIGLLELQQFINRKSNIHLSWYTVAF